MSLEIAEIKELCEVSAVTLVFGNEFPFLMNNKSVSKCSAVLALPPFPMIQIELPAEIWETISLAISCNLNSWFSSK